MANARDPGASRASAGLSRVKNVELFAAGERGGKPYTPADLDDIARNARDYGHLIQPPAKIGHGEQQVIVDGCAVSSTVWAFSRR